MTEEGIVAQIDVIVAQIASGKLPLSVGSARLFLMGVEWHRLTMQRAVSAAIPIEIQGAALGSPVNESGASKANGSSR